jgi:hypothetical protein
MRNLLTLLLVALACALPAAAQGKTGRESAGLFGPVRTVRIETARVSNVSGQLVEGERVLTRIASFDEKGNTTEQGAFNPDGSTEQKLSWGHTYDAKGRETEATYLNAGGTLTARAVFTYDERGRKVEATFYAPPGTLNHVEKFEYDERGRKTREVHLSPDGTIRNTQTFTYNADGRLTEWSIHTPDGALYQRNVHVYDEKGREAEWVIYRGDGTPSVGQKYVYDEKGNVTESLSYGNGVQFGRETYTYEFDAHGNWVKKRVVGETLKEGTTRTEIEVIYRTITYY